MHGKATKDLVEHFESGYGKFFEAGGLEDRQEQEQL